MLVIINPMEGETRLARVKGLVFYQLSTDLPRELYLISAYDFRIFQGNTDNFWHECSRERDWTFKIKIQKIRRIVIEWKIISTR